MFLKGLVMLVIGVSAGGMVAAGTFAFIVMLGVFTRLAYRTHTSSYTSIYESAIVLGGTLGNIILLYEVRIPLYYAGIIVFGLFCGIFVGCLAMALAEVLKVFPILVRRTGLFEGLPFIVCGIAAGKMAGAFVQFVYGWT